MLYAAGEYGPRVLCWANRCVVHQLFRGSIVISERTDLVKDMSSLASVFRISSRRDQFRRAVTQVLREHLDYRDGVQPPAEDHPSRVQNKHVLTSLLLDRALRVEFASPTMSTHNEKLEEYGMLMYQLLQGPWCSPNILHYCSGGCPCGGTKQGALSLILDVFFWLFSLMPDGQHFTRWAMVGPFCSWLSMCLLPHNIFKRSWQRAFGKEAPVPQEPENDLESFTVQLGRKIHRVTKKFDSKSKRRISALGLTHFRG